MSIIDQLDILRRVAKVGKARSEKEYAGFDPLDTFIHLLDEIERTRLHIMSTENNDLQLAEINTKICLKKLEVSLTTLQENVAKLHELNNKLKATMATLRLKKPFVQLH